MTTFYLDTSVAVHALAGTPAAQRWFDRVTADDASRLVSSRILRTELTRVLRREGRDLAERDLILVHVSGVPLTEAILTSAEAITAHVRTLDAIHLASALAVGSQAMVVTHDHGLKAASESVGLEWVDPVDGDS